MTKPADAWFPFYPADYLIDTMHLTTEEHGAYFLLLVCLWRARALPNDDLKLATIAGLDLVTWTDRVGPIIRPFFSVTPAGLIQKRMEHERVKAETLSATRRAAGLSGGRPKKQTESKPKAKAKPGLTPVPSPVPSPIEERKKETLPAGESPPALTLFPDEPRQPHQRNGKIVPLKPGDEVALAINAYNVVAAVRSLPQAAAAQTPARVQALKCRLRDLGGLDGWDAAMRHLMEAEFVNKGDWPSFSFGSLLKPETMTKLMEGGYRYNRRNQTGRVSSDEVDVAVGRVRAQFKNLMEG